MSPLYKVLIIAVVALSAAILLHLLFEANEADVAWGNTVRMGGPVAAFIGTFLILEWAHRRLLRQELESAEHLARARETELARLSGNWTISSRSDKSARRASSGTRLGTKGGRLSISGGTFYDCGPNGEKLGSIGDWNCEIAVFDVDRLFYVYSLADKTATPEFWRGYVDARLSQDSTGLKFSGRWAVFGSEHHEGEIELRKT